MSETAESRRTGDATEPTRETPIGVLGVAFGLLVVAGVFGWISMQSTEAIDGREVLVELFGVETLPLRLQVEEGARGPKGERIVRLVNPDAPADPEPPPEEESSETEDEGENGGEAGGEESEESGESVEPAKKRDEGKPKEKPEGEKGTPPREVILVTYPESVAVRELERLFGARSLRGGDDLGDGGDGDLRGGGGAVWTNGRLLMSSGTLRWKDLDARYFHQREYKDKRGYRDFIRVNLSQPGRYVVLFASWPIQYPGDPSRIEEILDVLEPLPIEE